MNAQLQDVTGFRGEKIIELALTDYRDFPSPLFRPGFLGDKWPAIDFYVELAATAHRRGYFLCQAKATTTALTQHSTHLRISSKKSDILRLLRIPGPTYIFGVHEPQQRVFVRAIVSGTEARAITKIPVKNELTSANLRKLYDEVDAYWGGRNHKPSHSVFQ